MLCCDNCRIPLWRGPLRLCLSGQISLLILCCKGRGEGWCSPALTTTSFVVYISNIQQFVHWTSRWLGDNREYIIPKNGDMNLARSIIRTGVLRHAVNNSRFYIRTQATTVDTGEERRKQLLLISLFLPCWIWQKLKCIISATQYPRGSLWWRLASPTFHANVNVSSCIWNSLKYMALLCILFLR